MQKSLIFIPLLSLINMTFNINHEVLASNTLYLAYPPDGHQTTAEQIFFIGSGLSDEVVTINDQVIQRSKTGNFAPSFPLVIGENQFILRQGNQTLKRTIKRSETTPKPPQQLGFIVDSLTPKEDIIKPVGEWICFDAIATPNAQVSVKIGSKNIPLLPQENTVQLPQNNQVLTQQNQTQIVASGYYQGCSNFSEVGNLGTPIFTATLNNKTVQETGKGNITILDQNDLKVIQITAENGVTRTGPSSTYSRLTPLPKGTQAIVTEQQGDWLRLNYGAWINQQETKVLNKTFLPPAMVRGISANNKEDTTEIIFPLSYPVPFKIQQNEQTLTLTLYNTIAQTDTIYLSENPLIKRLDWQQINPNEVEYVFTFKSPQQWGYDVSYEGTNLKLSLRHPPKLSKSSLKGVTILLDPGHGGKESGAKGPTGYPEKDINLLISNSLAKELKRRGATVYLTRETDKEVSLGERVEQINQLKPTLAISIHYNALPDAGDALNTSGIGVFWYHDQGKDLSEFLHQYLVKNLQRPSYGVYWNNLALTRPHTAPSVLLELGFMINPNEFEWITNPKEQEKLVQVLANGIEEWLKKQS